MFLFMYSSQLHTKLLLLPPTFYRWGNWNTEKKISWQLYTASKWWNRGASLAGWLQWVLMSTCYFAFIIVFFCCHFIQLDCLKRGFKSKDDAEIVFTPGLHRILISELNDSVVGKGNWNVLKIFTCWVFDSIQKKKRKALEIEEVSKKDPL